mgnify:CR=1 FL=1
MVGLDKCGILKRNTTAVHCIAIEEDGFNLLALRGTWVAHNPQRDMNNAVDW